MKKRILHILDKISIGSGVSSVVMNYYDKLEHSKLTFDFMLNKDVDAKTRAYIESNGSKIYLMPELKAINIFKYIKELRAFYKNCEYKIIHGHVANSAVFYLGAAKNVPYRIIHSHNTKFADVLWKRARNWVLTRFIKLVANRFIACSYEAAAFLFSKKNNALILNNAINTDKFFFNADTRKSLRKEYKIDDKFVIGHVGKFTTQKNHEFLIDVFDEFYKINNNAKLLLIGDGELYQKIRQKIKKLELEEAVLFVGLTDNINTYLNAIDVFVMPSLFEGLPVVSIEAQAAGLPVYLSDRITREAAITCKTVFLPLDKELWVNELQEVCQHEIQNRLEIGMQMKSNRFDIDTQASQLCEYYEDLLKTNLL
jgi:glycosyltransferase involved in cell wall biosynthesis